MNEETIFAQAIAIESEEERSQFLHSACGDDLELRQAVQKLIKLSDGAGSFLEHPAVEGHAAVLSGISPTLVFGNGSTRDGEGHAKSSDHPDMKPEQHDPDDEISLSFLEPATREDSLGRLGHYEILQVIGKGAFGTVLRAFDEKLQRVVAIKVLAPEMASTSPARKRFLREARASAQVRHDNVVSIYAVEDDPLPYLVMEYIPGETLQKRLDDHGPLDVPDVLRLGKQIADGLAAAHAQQLIHRDIKPGNILLETSVKDHVKITDFGLARTADDASVTQSGLIAGTPMYMAPEQALGQQLDHRADLFSFGSVLYQMLSGRPPFRAPTTVAVLKRVVEDTPRPIQEIIPESPTWLCEIIRKLHAKNPDERLGSAMEVSELFEHCLTEVQQGRTPNIHHARPAPNPVTPAQPKPKKVATKSRSHRPLIAAAAAALLLLVGLGITEATGVTRLASNVIRLTTNSGTLVIETDDPRLKVAVDGENVRIHGSGLGELTLKPGQYTVAALKDGKPVKQELVSITRNGKTVVRMSLEPSARRSTESPQEIVTRLTEHWSLEEMIQLGPKVDQLMANETFAKDKSVDLLALAGAFGRGADWPRAGKLLDLFLAKNPDKYWEWTYRQRVAATAGDLVAFERSSDRIARNAQIINPETRFATIGKEYAYFQPDDARREKARKFAEQYRAACPEITDYLSLAEVTYLAGNMKETQELLDRIPAAFGNELFRSKVSLLASRCAAESGNQERAKELLESTSKRVLSLCAAGDLGPLNCWNVAEILPRLRDAEITVYGKPITPQLTPSRLMELAKNSATKESNHKAHTTNEDTPSFKWPADAPPPAIAPFDAEQAKAHQQAWAKYLGVPVEKEVVIGKDAAGKDVSLKMALIPPGEFMMGSTAEEQGQFLELAKAASDGRSIQGIPSEGPQRRVRITVPFWLSRNEVTIGQFRAFVEATTYKTDAERDGLGGNSLVDHKWQQSPQFVWNGDLGFPQSEDHPVSNVTWNDATEFCKWLSQQRDGEFTLPTEAQWEYACRAGTATYWHSGDTESTVEPFAWASANSGGHAQPVAKRRSNAFQLNDMHGNVWEWCGDWFALDAYAQNKSNDPRGPSAGSERVIRGGGWITQTRRCRAAHRGHYPPNYRISYLGFRVAEALPVSVLRERMSASTDRLRSEGVTPKPFRWPADAPPPAIAPFDAEQAKAHQEAWAKHLGVPVEYTNSLGMKFRLIPPGEFLMGSTAQEIEEHLPLAAGDDRWVASLKSEVPKHQVILTEPFYLGVHEVTQGQYEKVMANNPSCFAPTGAGKDAVAGRDSTNRPVEQVTWIDAVDFCTKLSQLEQHEPIYSRDGEAVTIQKGSGYRLPHEAGWEFACRAGASTKFWNGDDDKELERICWFGLNSEARTHAVGELAPNPFGLFDIHGNVWEWIEDGWEENYFAQFQNTPAMDPRGPAVPVEKRGIRGGNWRDPASTCRSSARPAHVVGFQYNFIGFRAALTVDAVKASIARNQADTPLPANAPLDAGQAQAH